MHGALCTQGANPSGDSSRPLQRALVTIASSSPAGKPFPGSQQEATKALCHSEQVWTFLGEVSVDTSRRAAAWRWWSAQSFDSSLWAVTQASFQRTVVSPRPMLPWILLLFDGGGRPVPATQAGCRSAGHVSKGAVVSRPWRRGWILPCAAAAGRQHPLEEAGVPPGDGWRHGRLLHLWRNQLPSPQGLITPEPAPRFPLPWITVSWSSHKAFHRWSWARSTAPSTLQHKVLILGQGAGVWSWPQAEGSPF